MRKSRFEVSFLAREDISEEDVAEIAELRRQLSANRMSVTKERIETVLGQQAMIRIAVARDPRKPRGTGGKGKIVGMGTFVGLDLLGANTGYFHDLVIHEEYRGFFGGLLVLEIAALGIGKMREWDRDYYDDSSSREKAKQAFDGMVAHASDYFKREKRATEVFRNYLKPPYEPTPRKDET